MTLFNCKGYRIVDVFFSTPQNIKTVPKIVILFLVIYLRAYLEISLIFIRLCRTLTTNIELLNSLKIFFVALRPNAGQGLLILEVSRSHTTTYNSR
jgi:hypothetical protein